MTDDLIKRLRGHYGSDGDEAANALEAQAKRIAELEAYADPEALHIAYLAGAHDWKKRAEKAEALEQARLLGMGAERELRLMAERDEARAAVKRLTGALVNMLDDGDRMNKIAASEAMADPVVRRIVEE